MAPPLIWSKRTGHCLMCQNFEIQGKLVGVVCRLPKLNFVSYINSALMGGDCVLSSGVVKRVQGVAFTTR